ncbi:MAG: glycosyltransferase family 4 protein [Candidatus Krumholzibacteria bacterium]|nr:glycosyltransferase family 4 protein [Candidatus Krumholzibacteria bacterium]MDH4336399.1 glycosyltransferase family 4 protein [Candidatus Krumholzibacteria bacterium]MDH5269524.1 glycosyltransferase family 4 protein [Candidatus Krumholzibacteria bacterium]
MKRPRVLLVKPVLPFPPEQGTRVLSFAIVEALSEAFDVTVLARILDAGEEAQARALERWCSRVVTVLPDNRRSMGARIAYKLVYGTRALVTGRSLKSLYDCPGAFLRRARELARESFDLVIVEYWQLYPLLDVFPAARTVLLTHDIDLQVSRDRATLERGALRRALAAWRNRAEGREEVRAYRRAGRVWALTARDADSVRALSGGTPVDVLPFGLPNDAFTESATPREPGEILFMGAMGAVFNRDAIVHFERDIHPLLAGLPGIRFTIVGGALPPEASALGNAPGVTVTGHAPDPRVYLRRATCMIVPLRYAGGLRIRIIEAMAAGLPVVASPAAVAGMDLVAGSEVLVARTPQEYRDHVERLLGDPAFAASLSGRAREAVRTRYGPRARSEGIRALVGAAVRRGHA